MAKNEFLQLAHEFDANKHSVHRWLWSEKLDGQRCFWDGGISRGLKKKDVPFANTAKDERYKEEQIATGLWSRYGNVIHAPDWWLDTLPKMPLDGELYYDGPRQELREIISRLTPDSRWSKVRYYVFDTPAFDTILGQRSINVTNFKKSIKPEALQWAIARIRRLNIYEPRVTDIYLTTYYLLTKYIPDDHKHLSVLEQHQLPVGDPEDEIFKQLTRISDAGGEGLILRNPQATYYPHRSYDLLKVKKLHDAEGTVVGFTSGRDTDKGGKLRGLIGAVILDYEGKTLELSGFTDEERRFNSDADTEYAFKHPGQVMPKNIIAKHFKLGDVLTFKYRGKSKDGIPQEARYWRKES